MTFDDFYNELKKEKEEIESLDFKKQKELITKLKHKYAKKYHLKRMPTDIEIFLNTKIKIQTKPTRTIAGVSVVAIMTQPFKCPHGKCTCCPGGVDSEYGSVPQSYTGNEPATMRAIRNDYDPYLQVFNRLEQYVAIGQNFNKIELIIMGGTFPSYNLDYQNNFIKYAFKAMNDFSNYFFENDKFNFDKYLDFFEMPGTLKDKDREKRIKKKVLLLKNNSETSLNQEKEKNENSKVRCVALCIETRPDYAKEQHVKVMLNQGCTRVELGVQSIYDEDLKFLNRGHSVQDTIDATRIMKNNLLKVGYHMMLGLNNHEVEMFKELFNNDNFKPDALKIYPMLVIKGTKLHKLYKENKYIPVSTDKCVKIIGEIKKFIPEYVRIMRVQRDIPHNEVIAGVKKTNLRQYVTKYVQDHKIECKCIRCKEIKNTVIDIDEVLYEEYFYKASGSEEVFISAKFKDKLVGFLRLRKANDFAGVRELHVYGKSLKLESKNDKSSQHKGIGKELMSIAEGIAFNDWKLNTIKVISGIGVRNYYRKLGYSLDSPYMVKHKE